MESNENQTRHLLKHHVQRLTKQIQNRGEENNGRSVLIRFVPFLSSIVAQNRSVNEANHQKDERKKRREK